MSNSLGIILLNSMIFFATLSTVPRHWDPGKLIVNEQTFSIKLPKS
ncbi:MAG: hypothetical protein ACEY3B_02050 [Wolbachia sp.]